MENEKLKSKVKVAEKAASKSAQREIELSDKLKASLDLFLAESDSSRVGQSVLHHKEALELENRSLLDQINTLLVEVCFVDCLSNQQVAH